MTSIGPHAFHESMTAPKGPIHLPSALPPQASRWLPLGRSATSVPAVQAHPACLPAKNHHRPSHPHTSYNPTYSLLACISTDHSLQSEGIFSCRAPHASNIGYIYTRRPDQIKSDQIRSDRSCLICLLAAPSLLGLAAICRYYLGKVGTVYSQYKRRFTNQGNKWLHAPFVCEIQYLSHTSQVGHWTGTSDRRATSVLDDYAALHYQEASLMPINGERGWWWWSWW